MSENKRHVFKCQGCGKVKELDMGFAESRIPSPEESADNWSARQAQVPPVIEDNPEPNSVQEPEAEPMGALVGTYTLGDCPECGSMQWMRIGDMTVSLPPIEESPAEDPPLRESEPVDPLDEPQAAVTFGQHEVNVALPPLVVESIPEEPVKEKYKCVGCGQIEEFEAKLSEFPTCSLCGALDWEKVHA